MLNRRKFEENFENSVFFTDTCKKQRKNPKVEEGTKV
uniref:Uncharacterized protein n=1 Tax=Cucumis melo TaxID=3656 RepID=A0A9I9EJR8_CUCME